MLIQAFRYNLYGSRFQWIIVGYYESDWWLNNPGPCNTSEILQALNGTLQTRVAEFGYNINSQTMADLVCSSFHYLTLINFLLFENYFRHQHNLNLIYHLEKVLIIQNPILLVMNLMLY